MLTLRNIHKQYNGKTVLEDISLTVPKGAIVSLLGPSGSGKTTLLNILLGITPPDRGQLLFDDVDLTRTSMQDRGFNIVFQDYALFPNLNAYDNITYSLRNKGNTLNPSELEHTIHRLELEPHLKKKIHQLSGGQKQRVALARTLVTKPRLLLMDEPFSALDGVIRESIKETVKNIAREFQLTTIIVTHDPEEALTLSDQVLIINDGRIAQYDTPKNIVNAPTNRFVEDFILRQLQMKHANLGVLFGEPHDR